VSSDWQTYVAAARHLDSVRQDQRKRTQEIQKACDTAAAALQAQRARLDEKKVFIEHVQRLLRMYKPDVGQPVELSQLPGATAADNIREAERWGASAVETAEKAEKRGRQARIFPGWHPLAHAALVYGVFAILCALLQVYLLLGVLAPAQIGSGFLFVLGGNCLGLPILAFVAGLVVSNVITTPRIRDRAAYRVPLIAGLIICYLPVPVMILVILSMAH
jgi:hypothetical protein